MSGLITTREIFNGEWVAYAYAPTYVRGHRLCRNSQVPLHSLLSDVSTKDSTKRTLLRGLSLTRGEHAKLLTAWRDATTKLTIAYNATLHCCAAATLGPELENIHSACLFPISGVGRDDFSHSMKVVLRSMSHACQIARDMAQAHSFALRRMRL